MLKATVIKSNFRRFLTTTTIDTAELDKFKQLSSDWWNIFGSMKPLHAMNSVRVPFIANGLIQHQQIGDNCRTTQAAPLENLKILDIGCGGGILTEALGRLGATITGIDPNSELIEVAKQHLEKQNLNRCKIEYCTATLEDYTDRNVGQFDAVVASEVIEHIQNPDMFLDNCLKCLKPSGSLFITTINKTIWSKIFAIFVVENLMQIVPKSTHDYEKFIELQRLERLLLDRNCKIICSHGMLYNPISNMWAFSKGTCINYAVHAVKLKVQFITTIDQNHSKIFDDLSSAWWEISGVMKALHSMNSVRVPFIISGLSQRVDENSQTPLENLKILDVGCGGGILTEALGQFGVTITAIDPSPDMIETAKQHLAKQRHLDQHKINYLCSTIEDYADRNLDKFDAIVASEVIEHINNPEIFLDNCLKCLKTNGSFFITTQNRTIWSKLVVVILAGYLLRIIPKNIPKFDKFIELNHLQQMLLERNCKIVNIRGTLYNPFNNTWILCNNTSINYYVHAEKLR